MILMMHVPNMLLPIPEGACVRLVMETIPRACLKISASPSQSPVLRGAPLLYNKRGNTKLGSYEPARPCAITKNAKKNV